MKALIIDGYIIGLSPVYGVDISAKKEHMILDAINNMPEVEYGFICKLKENLEWDIVKVYIESQDDDAAEQEEVVE